MNARLKSWMNLMLFYEGTWIGIEDYGIHNERNWIIGELFK